MITLIGTLLIIGLVIYSNRNMKWQDIVCLSAFLSAVFVTLFGMAMFFTYTVFEHKLITESYRVDCKSNIYSIRNVDTINGSFFLGSGNISGAEYYYMFEKDGRGGMSRLKLYSGECFLFQDENETPYIAWQNIHYTVPTWFHVWPKIGWTRNTKYDIHIPSNSVIQKFEVK